MLSIVPTPDTDQIERSGAASIDLRLGRWFRTLRPSRISSHDITADTKGGLETPLTKEHFVRFGDPFMLHPRNFVLGVTLEWIRLPNDLAGYVTEKSSLGRRGLIIETAAGIQPGFSGCLALELSNVGEVPMPLLPGMQICQVFFHEVSPQCDRAKSQFSGNRKPVLGTVRADEILKRLASEA
jgi:dCTP deaminase